MGQSASLIFNISTGAIFGALARFGAHNFARSWQLTLLGVSIPVGVVLVNAVGCFLVGIFFVYAGNHPELSRNLVLGITVGFLGSLTTFSTFSLEALAMLSDQGFAHFAFYTSFHLGLCLAVTFAGVALGRLFSTL